ncbi:MAG TPA: protein-methionine-sulfoxide reductase heme-binding subunit MsrQ [Steroidobacteraceae bacterium]|nr:protein-methionine-sulfoxide reductase heme-binding subunit MsrQ [Steroidobacteraceae bacterium]
MTLNRAAQFRFIYKPLLFAACAAPAVVMLLAAFGKGPMDLGADPVNRLIHACGITALRLLLLTLAVTPLRMLTGWNDLVRLRRMLGLFAFFYVLAHFTVYAWLSQQLNLHRIGADIVKRPYITIGMLALLLLIPLAVTSTNGMMRRLGRRWTQLHRLVYVIVALGLWHFWWQVKKDIREPLLYVALFLVLMAFRYRKLKGMFWPARVPGRT